MLHLLVDTCVWLDLAKDYREQPVISALEDLIAARQIKLIVPQVVLDEFSRNKGRVAACFASLLKRPAFARPISLPGLCIPP